MQLGHVGTPPVIGAEAEAGAQYVRRLQRDQQVHRVRRRLEGVAIGHVRGSFPSLEPDPDQYRGQHIRFRGE